MPKILWRGDNYRLVDIGGSVPPVLEQNDGIDAMGDPIWRAVKATVLPVLRPKTVKPSGHKTRRTRNNDGPTLRESILAAIRASEKPVEVKDLMPGLSQRFQTQSVYAEITRLNKAGVIQHPVTGVGWVITKSGEQVADSAAAAV